MPNVFSGEPLFTAAEMHMPASDRLMGVKRKTKNSGIKKE